MPAQSQPRATLILNPAAGRASILHRQLPAILQLLAEQGYQADIQQTTPAPDSAPTLAAEAAKTSNLILACGGDGTVHGVLQGIANSPATLGVLPLGTANALARNLRLPLDPLAAMKQLLTYTSVTIPLGQIVTESETRYFTVLAGCGPDGALIQSLDARAKSRFGRTAYYTHAARLFLTRGWPAFQVDYRLPHSTHWDTTEAVAVMASRVPNLGGLFAGLTPRARLTQPTLNVQLVRPPAHLSMPAWFALARTRMPNPWVRTIDVEELRCTPVQGHKVYAQADAEPLGPIPLTLRILPNALRLLMQV